MLCPCPTSLVFSQPHPTSSLSLSLLVRSLRLKAPNSSRCGVQTTLHALSAAPRLQLKLKLKLKLKPQSLRTLTCRAISAF